MNPQLTQSEYQRTAKNPYRSFDGADGEVRVPNGEWYVNTKARTARMMKNGLSRGARQVYACLELATMGFDREKALVWEKVRTKEGTTKLIERPQTNADIAGLSGLDESDTSKFFKELCVEGLAEAREIIEGKGLHKGNIQLYSWAQPREPKKEESWVRAPTIPDWFPSEDPALQPLRTALSRRRSWSKIQNMDDGARTTFLVMCEETARTIKEAEEAVARLEDYACAQTHTAAHIKEDRQDRQEETDTTAAAVSGVQVLATPKPPSDQQQQSESPIPIPTDETTQVQEVLLTYGPCDLDSARRLIQRCRDKVPDATTDEIAQKIFECARNIDRGTRKPVGLLLDIVPKSFENYKRESPETGREIESKIAAWKKAVDEDWETDEGKAAAREHLRQHGISYP